MTKFSYLRQKKRLERKIRLEEKPYSKELSEALRNNDNQKLNHLLAERNSMTRFLFEEIDELNTKYLTDKAKDYSIPLHRDKKEMWTTNTLGRFILTDTGISELKSKIQIEERYHREKIAFWFSLVFGLISAITALIAVINSK